MGMEVFCYTECRYVASVELIWRYGRRTSIYNTAGSLAAGDVRSGFDIAICDYGLQDL